MNAKQKYVNFTQGEIDLYRCEWLAVNAQISAYLLAFSCIYKSKNSASKSIYFENNVQVQG